MADVTKVQASDGTIYTINDEDDYTKNEIDAMLADKADVGVSYTKAEEDALLTDKPSNSEFLAALDVKADKLDTYTKTEVDDLLDAKAGVGVSYTKTEDDALLADKADTADVNAALLLKADKLDTYTKSETDTLLADKADVGDSYTKAEDDALLADKANSTDVYTKTQVDTLLAGKEDVGTFVGFPDYTTVLNDFSVDRIYTATVDSWLIGIARKTLDSIFITVNGAPVGRTIDTNSYESDISLSIPLKAGDVVVFDKTCDKTNYYGVYAYGIR